VLFTKHHIPFIRRGRKTETRRFGENPRYQVGGVYKVQTRFYTTEYYGLVEILTLGRERLWECRANGGYKREGYDSFEAYIEALRVIHEGVRKIDLRSFVWVYSFRWFDPHKVLRTDMSNLQLLGAPRMEYRFDEWNRPLDKISSRHIKAGGLWVSPSLTDAKGQRRYMSKTYGVDTRIFRCRIGRVLYRPRCRIKTDKVIFTAEDEVIE